jgi:hypothetical protein
MWRIATLAGLVLCSAAHAEERAAPPAIDAAVMRRLFGDNFAPLPEAPAEFAHDLDEISGLVAGFAEFCPSREDGADDFQVADCRKNSAEVRARTAPVYIEAQVPMSHLDARYDFKRRGWTLAFTDDLMVGLSVWKPVMPDRIREKTCEDGTRGCFPMELPRAYRQLSIFIPMDETDARAWRDAWAESVGPEVWLSFLVSVRRGTGWSKSFIRPPFEPNQRPATHVGVLVRVHAMSVKLGARAWSYPDWYRAP